MSAPTRRPETLDLPDPGSPDRTAAPAPGRRPRGLRSRRAADPLWRAVAMLRVSPLRAAASVGAGALALGSAVALAAVSAWLIARASQMPPVLSLSVAVVAVRTFGISRGVFRYVQRLSSHAVALDGMVDLREEVYRRLASGPGEALASIRRGDVLARVGADVDSVGEVVVRGLIPMGVAAVVSAGSAIAVGVLLPAAGVWLAVCLALAALVGPALSVRSARRAEQGAIGARAEVAAATTTALGSSDQLRVSGRWAALMASLRAGEKDLYAANEAAARPAAAGAAILTGSVGLAVLGAFWLGIPAVTAGHLAEVNLAVVVLTPLAAFEAAGALPAAAVQVYRSRAAAARVMDLLDTAAAPILPPSDGAAPVSSDRTRADTAPAEPEASPTHPTEPQAPPARPVLVAEHLSCARPGREAVVRDLNLRVEVGRVVAVVGPSGVGKTTLLLTLAGLLPPAAGRVELDGSSIDALDRAQAARRVAYTAEDAHVFATTVLENLRVARGDVTPAEARELLGAVGLGPWLSELPEGLDTVLGPEGRSVSGGERRRLLLARALACPAPILLLDEPTEHLDAPGARALVAGLIDAAHAGGAAPAESDDHGCSGSAHAAPPDPAPTDPVPAAPGAAGSAPPPADLGGVVGGPTGVGRGLVLVTHRYAGLEGADEILVLRPGLAPRRGTHAELTATDAGYRWAWQQEREERDEW